MLRGEETQLLGVHSAPGSLVVLPGTYSKWIVHAAIAEGAERKVASFHIDKTGELFELLCKHSAGCF